MVTQLTVSGTATVSFEVAIRRIMAVLSILFFCVAICFIVLAAFFALSALLMVIVGSFIVIVALILLVGSGLMDIETFERLFPPIRRLIAILMNPLRPDAENENVEA